ncbi:MAG: methionine synthase, partial [Burkholderiales bacterium]|nr:methionine synthase [Burkholderiales bacterium]
MLFPTTIAGSLPKPAWLAEPGALWAPWRLDGEALAQGKRDAVRLALFEQERAGIDIVTDGEQTRRHFVTTFIEGLDGVDFERRRTVRIRNRYDADVPVVAGPVARRRPISVDDARFVRSQTARRVKYTLPGPMTMVDTLFDAHYRSREKLAWAFAEILNSEAREIAALGVDVIQFDEPAFNVYFDEVRDWGIAALERAAAGLACATAVHICYGYGIKANVDWKKTLGGEWRQYEATFPLLARSAIGQVSLECQNSRVPIDLVALLDGKDVLVGA